jgi:hypothetical protein
MAKLKSRLVLSQRELYVRHDKAWKSG